MTSNKMPEKHFKDTCLVFFSVFQYFRGHYVPKYYFSLVKTPVRNWCVYENMEEIIKDSPGRQILDKIVLPLDLGLVPTQDELVTFLLIKNLLNLKLLALYSTDDGPNRGSPCMSEEKKMKIKIAGQLMSEERKNKRDKLTDSPIIFTENDHFGGKLNQNSSMSEEKKLRWLHFFLVGYNSGS